MTTVAVTGASGIFGKALCQRLHDDPGVTRIVGVARRPFDPAAHGWTKMEFRSADVLDEGALDAAFAGVDVVVHLAFIVLGGAGDRRQMRAINVDGSRNAAAAAVRAGARRLVYASSVSAYGAHPDNPIPITEDWPTRGNTGFPYGEDKAAVEALLDEVEAANPDLEVVRIRPCVVVGPHSVDVFRGPLPVPVAGVLLSRAVPLPLPDPGVAPFQLVHEDDVAEVFALAVTAGGARGAYNLAGGGTLRAAELARELGGLRLRVPSGWARRVADAAHRAGIFPADGSWLEVIRHPVIVDTTRAREELGWVPAYDTRTALHAQLAAFSR